MYEGDMNQPLAEAAYRNYVECRQQLNCQFMQKLAEQGCVSGCSNTARMAEVEAAYHWALRDERLRTMHGSCEYCFNCGPDCRFCRNSQSGYESCVSVCMQNQKQWMGGMRRAGAAPALERRVHMVAWSGSLAAGGNVLDDDRMQGLSTAFPKMDSVPPAAERGGLPIAGWTCEGTAFVHVNDKIQISMVMPGLKRTLDFALEWLMKIQTCRARHRNQAYFFSRSDFLRYFAFYHPVMWLAGVSLKGDDASISSEATVLKDWKGESVDMPSLATVLLPKLGMSEHGLLDTQLDLRDITSCTALGFPTAGCVVRAQLEPLLGVPIDVTMDVQQCFGAGAGVPFGSMSLVLTSDDNLPGTLDIRTCAENTDCEPGWACLDTLSSVLREDLDEYFDLLISGEVIRRVPRDNNDGCSLCGRRPRPSPAGCASGVVTKSCSKRMTFNEALSDNSNYKEVADNYFECGLVAVENRFAAHILEWFSSGPVSPSDFRFCLPRFIPGLDVVDAVQRSDASHLDLHGNIHSRQTLKFTFLAPSSSAEQQGPAQIAFVFPPGHGFTWPAGTQRFITWALFHFSPPDLEELTLSLMRGPETLDSLLLKKTDTGDDADIAGCKRYQLPDALTHTTGYFMQLCAPRLGRCWQSGQFAVTAADTARTADASDALAESALLMPGNAAMLIDPQVRSRYRSGVILAIGSLLDVAAHRVEVYHLLSIVEPFKEGSLQEAPSSASADVGGRVRRSRRVASTDLPSRGIKVLFRLRRDDTGVDQRTSGSLIEQLATKNLEVLTAVRDVLPVEWWLGRDFFDVAALLQVQRLCDADAGACELLEIGRCAPGEQVDANTTDALVEGRAPPLKCMPCPPDTINNASSLQPCWPCPTGPQKLVPDFSRTECVPRNSSLSRAQAQATASAVTGVVAAIVASNVAVAVGTSVGAAVGGSVGGGGAGAAGGGSAGGGACMTLIMQVQFLNLVGKIGGDEKDEDFGAFTEGFGCVRERECVGCLSVCLSVPTN